MAKLLTAPLLAALLLLLWGSLRTVVTRRRRKAAMCCLGVTCLLAMVSMPAVTAKLARTLEHDYAYPEADVLASVDVITVLSSGLSFGAGAGRAELDQWSSIRTIVGARAFVEQVGPHRDGPRLFVVQGAYSLGEPDVLTRRMAELAVAFGVPPDRVRMESRSRNTREHPLELLRLGDISTTDVLAVVTSAWHLPRTVQEFERHFDHVIPIPADYISQQVTGTAHDWFPQVQALAGSTMVIHEWLGRLWYSLRAAVGPRLG